MNINDYIVNKNENLSSVLKKIDKNQLKKKLLTSKDNNPLFDNKSFTHNIEKAYSIIFEKHINEKDPEDVYL